MFGAFCRVAVRGSPGGTGHHDCDITRLPAMVGFVKVGVGRDGEDASKEASWDG